MNLHRIVVLALAFVSGAASAGWNSSPETIAGHPTWIYTPSTAMPDGKHPLLVVLHGCDQSHTQLKQFGNLVSTAEANGLVVAVPFVGAKAFGGDLKCWDYNMARDSSGNAEGLAQLANRLKGRAALKIEPQHVYVIGLSSGGAMALQVACKAPDVFAGVGAVAGPTVGSLQFMATFTTRAGLGPTNVSAGLRKCRELAGSKAAHLATQVANVAFGDMDKEGTNARFPYQSGSGDSTHPGQFSLVTVGWSEDNTKWLRELYGAGPLDAEQPVQGGLGTLQAARKDGQPRVSQLIVHDVGHAWPAGSGRPNHINDGGRWIAQSGLNYAEFAAGWLIANNLRATPIGIPELTLVVPPPPQGSKTISISGTAKDPGGSIANLNSVLLKANGAGTFLQVDHHATVQVGADGAYADAYDNLPEGRYKVRVTALDNTNLGASETSADLRIGNPPPLAQCDDFTDNNFNHVKRERAQLCSFAFVCAKGSGDNLGLFNVGIVTTVSHSSASPGVFRKGACPQP